MAAGQGFKTFVTGEVLTAGDVNGYLMQGINVFTNATARDAAITAPAEGQFAFTKDNNSLWYYDGAAWVASGATGDIEGVTAGVGISGGGTSGTVTITNSMATAIDAKGDLVAGTGADTFSRLAVGANDTVLTADSTAATGLKWSAPASGGMTLLSTTTLSGFSTTVSSISQAYTHLFIEIFGITSANNRYLDLKFNGGGNFTIMRVIGNNGTFQSQAQTNVGVLRTTYGEITANNANNVGSFTIYNYSATDHRKNVETHIAYNTTESVMTSSGFLSNSAVSSISFTEEAGSFTWTGGTVKIYGVK